MFAIRLKRALPAQTAAFALASKRKLSTGNPSNADAFSAAMTHASGYVGIGIASAVGSHVLTRYFDEEKQYHQDLISSPSLKIS